MTSDLTKNVIYIIGTCDTKAKELGYLKDIIESCGSTTKLVDVGTTDFTGDDSQISVSAAEVAACHPKGADVVLGNTDRGAAVTAMSEALVAFIDSRTDVAGIVGIGGSGGTALITPAMRTLPVGTPKLMVSTVASGDVAAYVGPTDITMMYSVVDVAGLNPVLKKVLANAGKSIAGMAAATKITDEQSTKPAIGLSMFGVTTAAVNGITEQLENDFDCLVFHATGTGGQSMEKLAESGLIEAALDITTTEVCDLLMGGVFPCLETRFDVFAKTELPYVGSVGALDMVNFGAKETVPENFQNRNLYVHNAQVTLMRTTVDENIKMGKWIAEKLNAMNGPVRFLLPLKGVSAIDAPDMPFHDPEATAALFTTIEEHLKTTANRHLIKVDANINDQAFIDAAVAAFRDVYS